MDKFAYWTLRILSYLFLISAAVSLIMWLSEHSYHRTPWIIWVSAIITSLFFSATSHVLARLLEHFYPMVSNDDHVEYEEESEVPRSFYYPAESNKEE